MAAIRSLVATGWSFAKAHSRSVHAPALLSRFIGAANNATFQERRRTGDVRLYKIAHERRSARPMQIEAERDAQLRQGPIDLDE